MYENGVLVFKRLKNLSNLKTGFFSNIFCIVLNKNLSDPDPDSSFYNSDPDSSFYNSNPDSSFYNSNPDSCFYNSDPDSSFYNSDPDSSFYNSDPDMHSVILVIMNKGYANTE